MPRDAVERVFDIDEDEAPVLHSCLRMQFFKEDSQDMYDFDKLVLFCILYCEADLSIKAQILFYLMADAEDDVIMSKGSKVKHIFSYLTVIACVITAEFIHSVSGPSTLLPVRYNICRFLPLNLAANFR